MSQNTTVNSSSSDPYIAQLVQKEVNKAEVASNEQLAQVLGTLRDLLQLLSGLKTSSIGSGGEENGKVEKVDRAQAASSFKASSLGPGGEENSKVEKVDRAQAASSFKESLLGPGGEAHTAVHSVRS